MELLQLKYFQKIAHLEHMTKAAEALSVSQPSLSKTLRMLEEELGVQLFDREGKYIRLNEYGKAYLKNVDIALAALEDGKRKLINMNKERLQPIYLAVLAASPVLPNLLSSFRDLYPNVSFQLLQNSPQYTQGDFDLCISSLPVNREGVGGTPLLTEEIFLAVPKGHRLADRKSVKLQEAANEGFIHLKPGNALREITDSFCKLAGFSPRIAFESDDPATVRGLITAGQGIGFIPVVSWRGTIGDSVVLLKIEEPVCSRTLGLFWMENRYQSEMVLAFRQFTVDYFQKLL